jgi:hypothetical protein
MLYFNYNVPQILKVGDIIIFFRGQNEIALRYAQDNLGVTKVSAPPKKTLEMPHYMFCRRQKKFISRT